MRVLIGCEESGVVRRAFRGRGHRAKSIDLLPARDKSPHHFQSEIMEFITHSAGYDLIILHPPCTYIAVSGNRWYAGTQERDNAIDWTIRLWDTACATGARVCLENPVGLKIPDVKPQWIQPYQFV